jgi:hypothetical protein
MVSYFITSVYYSISLLDSISRRSFGNFLIHLFDVHSFIWALRFHGTLWKNGGHLELVIDQFVDGVDQKLYGQGARKLVVIGLGPLGCIPSQRAAARRNGACNADLNRIVVAFNAAVKEAVVDQMGGDRGLVPGMKITFANPYPVIEEFLANPSRYGN